MTASPLTWVLLATSVAGIGSALVASVFLLLNADWRQRLLPHLVSFAIGVQLAVAFVALLPHAMEGDRPLSLERLGLSITLGIFGFFLLEKFILWHHGHDHAVPAGHGRGVASRMVLAGDAIHNFVHGSLIGAGFLTDFHLGLVLTAAVLAHELPQEIGDVAILVHSGLRRSQAFWINLAVSLTAPLGGIVAWLALDAMHDLVPYVLAVAIANLTYVAAADLIPGLHERNGLRAGLAQTLLIAAGIAVIVLVKALMQTG